MQFVFENQSFNIAGIHSDSRKIEKDYLFVAIKGTQSDGHDYIEKAIENGAKVIVHQSPLPAACRSREGGNPRFIQVADSAEALGKIASLWNGEPSKKLKVVGVTGTNGKTTIVTLLYKMFRQLGYNVGLLSTVCNYINDTEIPATHTTPDPLELNGLLAKMVAAGCEYVFMEVSSHSVVQQRIAGLQFAGGIFTNLTRDHLDYHETFEAYRDAKKGFFDRLPAGAFALTNKDDKNGMFMLQNTKASQYSYSFQALADFKGRILESHFDGTLMTINDTEVLTQFVGKFNAYNLLAVYGVATLLMRNDELRIKNEELRIKNDELRIKNEELRMMNDEILRVISMLQSVAGRFQTFRSPAGYTAIVDYAHTPDALVNVLNAIKGLNDALPDRGNIITVVGCGGNRDKGKRPMMAKEAVRLSDRVILSSDNPRFEEPEAILDDMFAGLDDTERRQTLRIADRKEAIRTACMLAQTGDVILIAGKGHEDYQEVKGVKHHFDDREIVREIFNS
ncbi:MAG: UDP-N-acetylmuramoyl-L-alanyl-D-glutamate--2,6-diaminopimelate ligase [Dysgonamonadaceae bacterium]|jgi:UDP-N-acetylmuramoyl-L-alanyl-D-glutamate--2,6-diaminopimelate ligase|nr:UDP-N-acetylmuramoyl-L-alanyl-D-glutamate--2,6-diaminopimelate ligase [Dysgonamonadaceae bacterium]